MAIGIRANTFQTNRDPGQPTPAPLPDLTPLDGPVATNLQLPIIVSVTELNEVLSEETIEIKTGIGTKIAIHGIEARIGQGGLLALKVSIQADKTPDIGCKSRRQFRLTFDRRHQATASWSKQTSWALCPARILQRFFR